MFCKNALTLTDNHVADFERDGFVIVHDVLTKDTIAALRTSFPRLFAGDFDTGTYPDEWHWREGISLPDVTRHICNAWKSDLTVASVVLNAQIAQAAARLTGWPGVRLGQDTIWWKTPHSKPIRLHQDSSFMDFLDPPQTITCWIALDDTRRDAGTLEYVPGSQHWPLTPIPADFHAPDDYRAGMRYAAEAAGISAPDPVFIEVPAGSVTFHVGEIWHGSGPNTSDNTMRRSLGIHLLRQNTRFSDKPGGYIYRRYQLTGDATMNESFFPVLWGEDSYRTPWLDDYCRTGMR